MQYYRAVRRGFLVGLCTLGLIGCASTDHASSTPRHHAGIQGAFDKPSPDYQKAALANVELGLGYLGQGQIARAKSKLTHAIRLAPALPEARSGMAYFLEMTGDYKDAEKAHKKAIRLSKNQGASYNNYGAFLCRGSRFQEADQAFHRALADKDYPRTSEIYENAGLCAIRAQHKAAAINYLRTAIIRDPSAATALIELAYLSLQDGHLQDAKAYWQRYQKVALPTARSLSVGIHISKACHDDNAVASQALRLKDLFEHSQEYADYLRSERTEVKAQ
ncbi:MAG: type IV pilus biogenesis/stability protein PilW [Gammaproteobacteria bacterium]|nr:type IV pilus biogenesis/stability protein PilW [Gammaproteobacteria bacterium]MBP9729547.1 type IV pilus biogenesis/stability protein PilW [Gammaproteobacteria bacterium]